MECPICRSINPSEFKFCGRCGSEINQSSGSGEKPSEHKSERKHVTVLFSDLSGYTAMTERLDPEEVRAILNKVFKTVSNIIEKFDGFIERYIGDSVMAVFGIPKAHEDDPSRAVHAAFEIHAAVKSMNSWIREKTGQPVSMHTGINTGLVVTGEVNAETGSHGLTGLTINIASRLEGLSKDEEILVGPETHKLTEHLFDFQALKPVQVKGKSELLPVYKALSKKQKTFSEPPKTSFSGRTEELALLTELSDQILRTGTGHIVFIIGDPGIGKSRLVEEYKKQLSHDGLLWLEGRSSSYLQETSYGTFLNILKKYAGIKDADDDINGWNKLEEKLTRLFPEEVPDTLPYLATLLSLKIKGNLLNKVLFLDGEAFKNQIFRAFYLFLKRLTEDRPVVLEFEDYHWADQSTVDLLGHLIPMVCDVPLLLLFVSRDTKNLPAAETRTLLQSEYSDHYSEIILEPLSRETILELACKKLNSEPISSELSGLIHRKCEGNPLYLEELFRTLNHGNLIEKNEATGQYTITPLAGKVPIPDTLRGIVESSIDRLDEDIKELLKSASVIGRNFFYRLLEAVEKSNEHLDSELSVLMRENLIRKNTQNPEPEYFFYHDLIRDAAYETILLTHREKLHRKVGEAIENIFNDQIEKFYGLLSYHFAKASQWGKAQKYLIKAGDQASRIAGDSEALAYYKKALAAHEQSFGNKLDDFEKAVYQRKLGEIYFRRGEHDKALISLRQAFHLLGITYPFGKWRIRAAILNQGIRQIIKRICRIFHSPRMNSQLSRTEEEVCNIFETMIWIDFFINQERLAFDLIAALNYAERIESRPRMVQGYAGMGLLSDTLGLPSIARKYHDLSMRQIQTIEEGLITATVYLCLGYHYGFQGRWKDALESYEKSADQFKTIGHLKKWGNAKLMSGHIFLFQGQFARSLEISMDIAQAGLETGDHQLRGHGLSSMGANQIYTDSVDEAMSNLKQAVKLLESIPDYYALGAANTDLARCYLTKGDVKAAHAILKNNEKMITQKGLHGFIVSLFYNTLAEAWLNIFETSIDVGEKISLGKLKHYISKATRHARHFACGRPRALRLKALFFWLAGDPRKARKFWEKGLGLCQELNFRHEEGLIYSDMGNRLHDSACLKKAREIFMETGANLNLIAVKKSIEAQEASRDEK
ncbi:MAG: AAA family ATPase [Desulfobacula sp.]|nr:AAA family ATPase [Desulfobacula sp.]